MTMSLPTSLQQIPFRLPASNSPMLIPLSFEAISASGHPINSVTANFTGGAALSLVSPALGPTSLDVVATGSIPIYQPGTYFVDASAGNDVNTSTATVVFFVTGPPTVVINQPTQTAYTSYVGDPPLSLPFVFTPTSYIGGVTALSATLGGVPVNFPALPPNTLTATVTADALSIAPASSTQLPLVVTVGDAYGTGSATETLNVTVITPRLTVAIDPSTPTSITGTPATPGTASATGTGTFSVGAAGTNTFTALATGTHGLTASATATITVTETKPVSPPTVKITQPTASTFTYYAGDPALSIPFAFTATSSSAGGITALTDTLDGKAIQLPSLASKTLTTTFTTTLAVSTGGSHSLVVNVTDANGSSSASVSFTVNVITLTLTISPPTSATVVSRVAGSAPTGVPFSFTATGSNGIVTALSATLATGATSSAVAVTPASPNSATATGTSALSISAGGAYIFTATALGTHGLKATSAVTFTVKETPPPCTTKVVWLPPVSLGRVRKGGSVVPIQFLLQECCSSGGSSEHDDGDDGDGHHSESGGGFDCGHAVPTGNCASLLDKTVILSIYEVFANGKTSVPTAYAYGRGSPNPPTYAIDANFKYQLNFATANGSHRYHVDVDRFPNGATVPQLVGAVEFTTK